MRLAVIGSRTFTDYTLLQKEILQRYGTGITIVSGEAPGADSLGKLFSDYWLIPYLGFPAAWDDLDPDHGPVKIKYNKFGKPYNALAGFNRNKQIIANADICLAFWDGKSPGTKDSIDLCRSTGVPVATILVQ